jgi:hypothetical protein
MEAATNASLVIEAFDAVASRPVVWLWPCRLAYGKLAIFDGDPGLGKSLVALDLCARVSTGRDFPDGTPNPGPSNVIVFHGEDAAEDVVNPRLEALAADRGRIYHVHRLNDLGPEQLCFPVHVDLLEEAIQRVRPVLVVIDPIMAFLDRSVCTGDDPSVRTVLGPLAQLAEKYNCVIILIRHLNKNAGKRTLYRGAGSMAFLAVCRSAWLFARHPSHKGQAVIAEVKNNLAPPQTSLAYEVIARTDQAVELHWRGDSTLTAGELLHWADRAFPPRLRAREFLKEFLRQGPQPSDPIWDAARKLNLAERTLTRARKELKIRVAHVVHEGNNIYYWLLPDQVPPLSNDPAIRAFEEKIEEIRAQLPPRNPLDPVGP